MHRDKQEITEQHMQRIEVLCNVVDAALQKLPDWLSGPELALDAARSHNSLSQVLRSL